MKKIYTLLLGFGVALNVVAQMPVSQGTKINVKATPKPGYRFIQWSDGNIENPRSITVMDNVDLVAEFYYNDYTLTTQVNYADRGTVNSGGSVQYTQTKELTATPNYGYVFKNWTVSGSGSSVSSTTANPITFTMGTANATVTANFDYDPFEITAITDQPHMGTVSGSGSYNYLSEQYVTATPLDARYRFVSWSDGNTDNPRSITITKDETYTAIFEQTHAWLTISPSEKNAGTFDGPGFYEIGEKVLVQANPAPYYRFVKWSDGSTQNPRRITMTGDITLTAYFVDELAEESFVNPGQVLVEPDSTNAMFSWPQTEGSNSYSLEIKKDGVVFCTLEFNEYGQLAGIDFTTRAMTKGFQFKVTGLEEDSDYRFSLKAKDASENVIASYAGDFSTRAGAGSSIGESNLGNEDEEPGGSAGEGTAVSENANNILAYGLNMQVIVKGAFAQTISVYNVVGQLLETRVASSDIEIFNVYPEGVYIVNVGEEIYKVVVK